MENKNKTIFTFLLVFTLIFSSGLISAYGNTYFYVPETESTSTTGADISVGINWDSNYPDLLLSVQVRETGSSNWNDVSGSEEWKSFDLYNLGWESSIGGLDPATEYEYRVISTAYKDSGGNTYSGFLDSTSNTFTTDYDFPDVEEAYIEDIGQTSAEFNSQISSLGTADSVEVYFDYGGALNTKQSGEYSETISSSYTPFSYTKTGLDPDTYYIVEACAYDSDNDKETCGNSVGFATNGINKPVVSTLSPTDTSLYSARLRGELDSLGDYSSADVKFFYKKSEDSTYLGVAGSQTTLSSPDVYTYQIEDLLPGNNYDYKIAYYDEEDSEWVLDSSYQTFTTTGLGDVNVNIQDATNVLSNSAKLNGEVILGDYENATALFSYKKSVLGSWTQTAEQNITSSGTFSQNLTGLDNNTNYEFRAEVINYCDASNTCYSDSIISGTNTFTTLGSGAIEIETLNTTNINSDSVILNSKLNEVSEQTIGIFWEYKELGASSWTTTTLTDVSTPEVNDEYSKEIIDLSPNTDYEIRAGAYSYELDNNYYGSIKTITTESPSWKNTTKKTITSPEEFKEIISELEPDSQYEFRAVMENGNNTDRGGVLTFTTELIPPTIDNDIKNIILKFNQQKEINLLDNYNYYDSYGLNVNGENIYSNTNLTNQDDEKILNIKFEENKIILKSFETEKTYEAKITLTNSEGSTIDEFNIKIEPTFFQGIVDGIVNIFPESDDLTGGQKAGYVLVSILVLTIILVAIGVTTGGVSKGIIILTGILDFIVIFFYTAIGYISVGIFITLILIAIALTYLKIRGGSE